MSDRHRAKNKLKSFWKEKIKGGGGQKCNNLTKSGFVEDSTGKRDSRLEKH